MVLDKELRIGNYVNYKRHNVHNDDLHLGCITQLLDNGIQLLEDNTGYWALDYDELTGVPLTKELLLNFGFEKHDDFGPLQQLIYRGKKVNIVVRILKEKGVSVFNYSPCNSTIQFVAQCEYVHRFQNLIFELGEELTIKE